MPSCDQACYPLTRDRSCDLCPVACVPPDLLRSLATHLATCLGLQRCPGPPLLLPQQIAGRIQQNPLIPSLEAQSVRNSWVACPRHARQKTRICARQGSQRTESGMHNSQTLANKRPVDRRPGLAPAAVDVWANHAARPTGTTMRRAACRDILLARSAWRALARLQDGTASGTKGRRRKEEGGRMQGCQTAPALVALLGLHRQRLKA